MTAYTVCILTPRPITVRGRSLYIVVRSNVYSSSRIIELYIAKETNQSCAVLQGCHIPSNTPQSATKRDLIYQINPYNDELIKSSDNHYINICSPGMKNDNHTTLQCSTHATKNTGSKMLMVSSRRGIENRNNYTKLGLIPITIKSSNYPRIMFAKTNG